MDENTSKKSIIPESIFLLTDSDDENSLSGIQDQNETVTSNEIRIEINQVREKVFEFTLEPKNTPKWCVNIEHEEIDTDQIGIGTKYKNDFGELEVTDYEQNVYFELTEIGTQYQCSYSFRKIDDEHTELIYFEGMLDGSKLLEPMDIASFENLKEVLEK